MSDAYCDEEDRERRMKKRKPRRDLCMICGCPYTETVNGLGHETVDECCDALQAKVKRLKAENKRLKKELRAAEEAANVVASTGGTL